MMDTLEDSLMDFSKVFNNQLGTYKGQPVSHILNPPLAPIQMRPHDVAFTLFPSIDAKIDQLVKQGVLEVNLNTKLGHSHGTHHEAKILQDH